MSQSLVFTLLALALVLPLLGAIVLRLLVPRLSRPQLYVAAALIFGVALVSVLALAQANVSSLQVGELSLLLPAVAPGEGQLSANDGRPTADVRRPTAALTTSITTTPAETATSTATSIPTAAPTIQPTAEPPTAIPPTAPPTVPPTAPPTAPPPTAAPKPSGRSTYIVKPGDTLRGIAEKFNVGVEALIKANKLTPAQADSLKVGQELVIP